MKGNGLGSVRTSNLFISHYLRKTILFLTAPTLLMVTSNDIAIVKISRLLHAHGHTRRSSGEKNSAGFKGGALADKAYDIFYAEKKITGGALLALLAVDQSS